MQPEGRVTKVEQGKWMQNLRSRYHLTFQGIRLNAAFEALQSGFGS